MMTSQSVRGDISLEDTWKNCLFAEGVDGWTTNWSSNKVKVLTEVTRDNVARANQFLYLNSLPEVVKASQSKFILIVSNDLWEQKILPIVQFYEAYENSLYDCHTEHDFKEKSALKHVTIPDPSLLTKKIQDKLAQLGIHPKMTCKGRVQAKESILDNELRFHAYYFTTLGS